MITNMAIINEDLKTRIERYRQEDIVGVQFETPEELGRAGEFLMSERLPFEMYGFKILGVYKTVRDYLEANSFKFKDYRIIHTKDLSGEELTKLREEQYRLRKQSEERFMQRNA